MKSFNMNQIQPVLMKHHVRIVMDYLMAFRKTKGDNFSRCPVCGTVGSGGFFPKKIR